MLRSARDRCNQYYDVSHKVQQQVAMIRTWYQIRLRVVLTLPMKTCHRLRLVAKSKLVPVQKACVTSAPSNCMLASKID
jgi:hypothetical protein